MQILNKPQTEPAVHCSFFVSSENIWKQQSKYNVMYFSLKHYYSYLLLLAHFSFVGKMYLWYVLLTNQQQPTCNYVEYFHFNVKIVSITALSLTMLLCSGIEIIDSLISSSILLSTVRILPLQKSVRSYFLSFLPPSRCIYIQWWFLLFIQVLLNIHYI